MARAAVIHATATRPHPEADVNGDAVHVVRLGGCWRLAVIDGLGHGPQAAAAAGAIVAALAASQSTDIEATLLDCHAAARGTRGAAVSVVVIDLAASALTFAGIGNVEGRVRHRDGESRLVPARGIVGATVRRPNPETFPLGSDWRLVLHSDGISARFELDWDAHPAPGEALLQQLADSLLEGWARTSDDATVVIAAPLASAASTPSHEGA